MIFSILNKINSIDLDLKLTHILTVYIYDVILIKFLKKRVNIDFITPLDISTLNFDNEVDTIYFGENLSSNQLGKGYHRLTFIPGGLKY
jgi:hypothetical protein